MPKIQFYPLDIIYKKGIIIFGKTIDNKRIVIKDDSLKPYFYVEFKSNEKIINRINSLEEEGLRIIKTEIVKKEEKELIKIIVNEQSAIKVLSSFIFEFPGFINIYEDDIPIIQRYLIDKEITPLTLCEVEGEIKKPESYKSDYYIESKVKKISEEIIKNLKILSIDIETYGFSIKKHKEPIISIALYSENYKEVITYKKGEDLQKYVKIVKDEPELLEEFKKSIEKFSPDLIIGYFSDDFDFPYINTRAQKYNINLNIGIDNSILNIKRGLKYSKSRIIGIPHLDIYQFISKIMAGSLKLDSYNLNSVAEALIGDKKDDLNLQEISDYWDKGKIKEICKYNLQDTLLTYKIFQKILPNLIEITKITSMPIYDVVRMSYGSLSENYLIKKTKEFNILIPRKPHYGEIRGRQMHTYQGAFVLTPKPGFYKDLFIFDFKSLYPSIIVSKNIDIYLLDKNPKNKEDYICPEITEEDGKKTQYCFSSKKEGFIPQIIKDLILRKNRIKEIIKNEINPDKTLLARAYALKTIANSSYGYYAFFGARWYCRECAAAITSWARDYIQKTIKTIKKSGFEVIYGDSVSGKTKILIKKDDRLYEEKIENIFKKIDKKSSLGKEYNFKKDIEVLTLDEKGNSVFKPIVYVMRHKCNKKMYKINFTNKWNIDVTEDHSLMGYQSCHFNQSKDKKENPLKRIIELKPNEIKKKANTIISLKKIPYDQTKSKNYPKKVYEFIGFFIGDGSFMRNKSHKKNNKDYYLRLSLGKDEKEVFDKLIKPLIKLKYIKNYWWSKTRKGDLTINGLKLIKIISENCRDKNNKKIIPSWLFEEKEENIALFLKGIFSADGTVMIRNGAPIIKFTSINDKYIEQIRKLLYRTGISHSVFKENKKNKYKTKNIVYSSGSYSKNIILKNKEEFVKKIGFTLNRKNKRAKIKTKGTQKKLIKDFEFDIQQVRNIKKIKTQKYVYDIEVEENHRFFANYVLVHNTDSIAFTIKDKTQKQALDLLKEINKELPSLMELELEDFYPKAIFVEKKTESKGAKKKYALIDSLDRIKIVGFETIRRDWSYIARNTQKEVIERLLKGISPIEVLEYVKEIINKIKNKEIKIQELVIQTQLKMDLEKYTQIGPHVAVAQKMREKGHDINAGATIMYVISKGSGKIRDRAVLPEECKEYDEEYYINNQIIPSVEKIFEIFNIKKEQILEKEQSSLSKFT